MNRNQWKWMALALISVLGMSACMATRTLQDSIDAKAAQAMASAPSADVSSSAAQSPVLVTEGDPTGRTWWMNLGFFVTVPLDVVTSPLQTIYFVNQQKNATQETSAR